MKVDIAKFRPLPGCMVLRLEGYFDGEMQGGLIEVPQIAQSQPHQVGVVVTANVTPDDIKKIGHVLAPGDRVLMPNYSGRAIDDHHQVYRCIDAEGLLETDAQLGAVSQEIGRCNYCGAARTGTDQRLLLDDEGVCPRCFKNERGVYQDPDAVTVSDDEVNAFSQSSGMFR